MTLEKRVENLENYINDLVKRVTRQTGMRIKPLEVEKDLKPPRGAQSSFQKINSTY